MNKYPKTISEAAKLLDKVHPDWFSKISLEELKMTDGKCCILGQLYGSWTVGIRQIFKCPTNDSLVQDAILGRNAIIFDWKSEILKRRNKTMTFQEALQAAELGKKVRHPGMDDDYLYKNGETLRYYRSRTKISEEVHLLTLRLGLNKNWEIVSEEIKLEDLANGTFFMKDGKKYKKLTPPLGYTWTICVPEGVEVKEFYLNERVIPCNP
jgi:hypothetical protein